jgi:hypothetical protein
MKNLLIYVNPEKKFDDETSTLIKIQIDNSLELGWRPEDIILITNFPYEFMGVKSVIVGDELFNTFSAMATKVDVMAYLFDSGFIKDELYFVHDLDAYQQEVITEAELEMGDADMALCDYGRIGRWNGGVYFINNKTGDIFRCLKSGMYDNNINEEEVLMRMTKDNINGINGRLKKLNIRYNFGLRRVPLLYEMAIKPIKIIHFHPNRIYGRSGTALNIAMHGANKLRKPMMNQRLINLFKKYGHS